jgi:NAD(P)-dependent dehydrogenase (short-subunit alcohol dehydrogenase family)
MLIVRHGNALAHAADGTPAAGARAGFAVADVADREALERAGAETIARFGRLDTADRRS